MAEGARMGVEPQFSGWEIGSPPRASFLIPPLGPGCACGSRGRTEEGGGSRGSGGAVPLADSRPCPPRRGQACKDPRGVDTSLAGDEAEALFRSLPINLVNVKKLSHQIFQYMYGVLNEVYLQIFFA